MSDSERYPLIESDFHVFRSNAAGLEFRWYGGLTVNVFAFDPDAGEYGGIVECDVFTFADQPTIYGVKRAINEYISDHWDA